ncbi:MAG: VgrG-related protein, partial [Chloroflexi bacterium]|nr:VgrG-related protein [Chloroflexota bacterium]
MPNPSALASQIVIKVDGTEVERAVMARLLRVVVEQHVHLPDVFAICLHDIGLELLDGGPFDLTKEVEILAETTSGEEVTLIKGEVTALEPNFGEGMIAELVVRGYDPSHRLYRESKSVAHLNKKDSDLAQEIAQAAGLQAEIDTTDTVYEHIFQHNQSDLAFLMQRAWRIGYECFVSDGTLYFRRPPSGGAEVTLTWGQDLLSFRPRMTLAEQVDEVLVKGWDVERAAPIVGRAQQGRLYPDIGETRDGASWASAFGTGKLVILDQSVLNQAEADTLAAARLNEISGAFVEAEGMALRHPEIKAGRAVTLEALGDRFSGTYLVTGATHLYTAAGLKTLFHVYGSRKGLLSEQLTHRLPLDRWPGVVTAIVTNTDDPNNWGRVKLKFPWMTEDAESDWARVVGIGAGPEAGFFVMPEVDDEVLVAFEHGDFARPFVIGGLWNGQHALPPEGSGAASGEKPLVRTWHSRSGHWMAMYDNNDNKVEVVTAGGHTIVLDDRQRKVSITSSGGLTLELDDSTSKITVESGNEVAIKATGNLKIESSASMEIKATQLTLEGTATATFKAPTVSVEGSGVAELKGG